MWRAGRRPYTISPQTLDVDIVEDHAVLLESLAVWLEQQTDGIRVAGRYGSWAEFEPHLSEPSDVVILDALLGDSIPIPAKIRAIISAGPHVVVCSSVTEPAVIHRAYAAGALAYVPKTSPAVIIETAIRSAAEGQKYVPEDIAAFLFVEARAPQLTVREHDVVSIYLRGEGSTMAETAHALGISVDGVKKHLVSVRRKYHDDASSQTAGSTTEKISNQLKGDALRPHHPRPSPVFPTYSRCVFSPVRVVPKKIAHSWWPRLWRDGATGVRYRASAQRTQPGLAGAQPANPRRNEAPFHGGEKGRSESLLHESS